MRLLWNKTTKKWLQLEIHEEKDNKLVLAIANNLMPVLDAVKKDLKKDLDFGMVITGSVGAGKSNAARIVARYVSNEHFHPKTHIVQDVNDIERVFKAAKKGDAVIFDEGSGIFASTDTTTKKTKYANLVLDVCRQRNLCLIILAPAFHRLGPTVALERSKVLLRVYMKGSTRGPFAFYGKRLKEKLYHYAKKNMGSMKGVQPKWRGYIGKDHTFTKEYRAVKDETFKKAVESLHGAKKPKTEWEIRQEVQQKTIVRSMEEPSRSVAVALGITQRQVQRLREKYSDTAYVVS